MDLQSRLTNSDVVICCASSIPAFAPARKNIPQLRTTQLDFMSSVVRFHILTSYIVIETALVRKWTYLLMLRR